MICFYPHYIIYFLCKRLTLAIHSNFSENFFFIDLNNYNYQFYNLSSKGVVLQSQLEGRGRVWRQQTHLLLLDVYIILDMLIRVNNSSL